MLMIMKIWATIMLIVMGMAGPAQAYTPFHPAATDAEKTLEQIIQRAQTDEGLPRYLLQHKATDRGRDKDNLTMFTPALLRALIETEANLVQTRCGGNYLKGEKCGITYNPLTCMDFRHDQYFFRTDSAGAFSNGDWSAVIALRLPEGTQIIGTYTMLKVDGKWKIDGIDCTQGDSFNM